MERSESPPVAGERGERRIYQFGDFRVDPVRRRLLRGGEPIQVTSKTFSLLVVLLERRGEVLEKDQLIKEVWPDTYVTEANLTQNISSLRKALGERAGDRRYIVTVPGQGYSFIAEVSEVQSEASGVFPILRPEDLARMAAARAEEKATAAAAAEAVTEAAPRIPPSPLTTTGVPVAPARQAQSPPVSRPRSSVLSLCLLLAVAAFALLLERPAGTLPENLAEPGGAGASGHRLAVAILGFKDLSGSDDTAWLTVALSEMLSTELSAGGQARLISGEHVNRARQALSIPYADSFRGADLQRLQKILGADLVIVGSYLVLPGEKGRQIRLDLRVMELPSGTVVASLTEVGTEADLFETVAQAGARLRQSLGLGELSGSQARTAQSLHPADPEAARLAAEGLGFLRSFDPASARERLEQAVEIEPESAVIHSLLARAWADIGDDPRAREQARRAVHLARLLPRQERLAIEARSYDASRQWRQASEVYRSLWTFFPDETEYGLRLATALINDGHSRDALPILDKLKRSPAGRDDARIELEEARAAMRLADPALQARAARTAAEKARRSGEKVALAQALIYEGDSLLSTGLPAEATAQFRQAEALAREVGHVWTVGMALANLARGFQAQGQLEEAEATNRQSLALARQIGSAVGTAVQLYSLGVIHQGRGEYEEALRLLQESRTVYVDIGDRLWEGRVLVAMAQILLRQGDLQAAQETSEEAVAAAREVGNYADEARALDGLASILSWKGEIVSARQHLDASLRLLLGHKQPVLATTVLASSADVLARLGQLETAGRRLEQAVAAERRGGDKMASGLMLASRARLSLRTGDVARAEELGKALLRLAQETGARSYEGWALQELGRAQRMTGKLVEARRSLEASIAATTETGDAARTEVTRLELARLELSEKRPREAASLARRAAEWAGAGGFSWLEAQALAVYAEALVRDGRLAEARQPGERIRLLGRGTQDRELALLVAGSVARVDAAAGDFAGAMRDLREAVGEAERIGLVPVALELRLVMGEIEASHGRGNQTLREVRTDAQARGFGDLARRAAAAGG